MPGSIRARAVHGEDAAASCPRRIAASALAHPGPARQRPARRPGGSQAPHPGLRWPSSGLHRSGFGRGRARVPVQPLRARGAAGIAAPLALPAGPASMLGGCGPRRSAFPPRLRRAGRLRRARIRRARASCKSRQASLPACEDAAPIPMPSLRPAQRVPQGLTLHSVLQIKKTLFRFGFVFFYFPDSTPRQSRGTEEGRAKRRHGNKGVGYARPAGFVLRNLRF